MAPGVPHTANPGLPVSPDVVKSASTEFSKAVVGHVPFNHIQFTAPHFKATVSFLKKRDVKASDLVDLLKSAHEHVSITTSRIVNSNLISHKESDSADCYQTLEVLDEASSQARQYMSKATWRRQHDGNWLISDYSCAQTPSASNSSTGDSTANLLGLFTPPDTPQASTQPIKEAIGETLKAMMAQYPAAINSRQFDITQPPWSYIAQDKFTATMPPMESHKMNAAEMIKFLQAVTAHSPDARSKIIESSAVVREYIGVAEVWQFLEMRDTARSQGVVHNYIEKMVFERQDDGSWLAIEYSNMPGLDRAALPR